MKIADIKARLDALYLQIDTKDFIDGDPISIPKQYNKKGDIEISAFLAATLAWGQRKTIINNLNQLMQWMDHDPLQFILNHQESDLQAFQNFKHRTFNATDCLFFISALKHIYSRNNSLEDVFIGSTIKDKIMHFRQVFFSAPHMPQRTSKHVSNPVKGSASKRLNMFLRWMVRKDNIDFGIWNSISCADLMCPLDVHVKRSSQFLGLLERKQDDWKAVEELTANLRLLDSEDPVKYDLPLFVLSERGLLIE